jgi:hypothetical protein
VVPSPDGIAGDGHRFGLRDIETYVADGFVIGMTVEFVGRDDSAGSINMLQNAIAQPIAVFAHATVGKTEPLDFYVNRGQLAQRIA